MRVALTKHYVDVVTDAGDVAIAYWAHIDAAGVSRDIGGVVRSSASLAARALTLHGGAEPAWNGDHLGWVCAPLDLVVDVRRDMRPFSRCLLETSEGRLTWQCSAARAQVHMTVAGEHVEGLGYVERLESSVAPWRLPLSTLRWGRWNSPKRSLVWIVWDGTHPRHLVWEDGRLASGAAVTPSAISVGGETVLTLDTGRVVTDATVGEQLTSLRPLRSLVDRVAGSRQTRWVSRGTWRDGCPGWAIHEVVHWI